MAIKLQFEEPSIGWQDRSSYIDFNRVPTWQASRGQRWQHTVNLIIQPSDSYAPSEGWPVYMSQTIAGSYTRLFAGTIETIETTFVGDFGWRTVAVSCVSYESAIDSILLEPQTFEAQAAGTTVAALLAQYPTLPFATGTISAGATVAAFTTSRGNRLSDVISYLATQSGFIWGVDPKATTPAFYFDAPATVTAPFTFSSPKLLWETAKLKTRRSDFRDRQIIQASFAAFAPTIEVFHGDGHTTLFNLRNPIDHIVSSTLTTSTRATVTGIYTGQPSANDTLTVGNLPYIFVATLDNTKFGQILIGGSANATWQNFLDAINATVGLGGVTYSLPTWENSIFNSITALNTGSGQFVLTAKKPGEAANNLPVSESVANFAWHGGSQDTPGAPPAPIDSASADNPIAFSQCIFRHLPADGDTLTLGGTTYTWKAILTATPNQILIDTSLATRNMVHLIDAVDGNPLEVGINYSTGTTANSVARLGIIRPFGASFPFGTVLFSSAVYANVLAYTPSPGTPSPTYPGSGSFEFQAITPTAAGVDDITAAGKVNTQDAPGSGTTSDPKADVSWSIGRTEIVAQVAPAAGVDLVFAYYRLGADMIALENSPLVATRAAAEHGTGRYDQFISDSNLGNAFDALAKAQAALAAYEAFPGEFGFQTDTPGLLPGQLLTVNLTSPTGAGTLINGDWLIQDVGATLIPGASFNPQDPGSSGDFFRFTVSTISTTSVQTDTQFVERLAQTGGSEIGPTGPILSTSPTTAGAGGGGTGSDTPVEEVPIGNLDGLNTTFTLTWAPRIFPKPDHQLLRLTLNGDILNPFGYGSPAILPDFTIADNVVTLRVAPNFNDSLLAMYWPDVGVPQLGSLTTATVSLVESASQSLVSGPIFARSNATLHPTTGPAVNVLVNGSGTYAQRTDTATWSVGGVLPDMTGVYMDVGYGNSLNSGGSPHAFLYVADMYVDFIYANADPSLPTITMRYKPTGYLIFNQGSQCTMSASIGPPTATFDCSHTSGLSDSGLIRFEGWTFYQRIIG